MSVDKSRERFFLLSKRKKEILRRVCMGMPYKVIAEELFITESTVKAHMAGIYTKLGLMELQRDDRIFQIKSVYCPMLQEEEDVEIIDADFETGDNNGEEEINEDISPELNAIILCDEKIITTVEGGTNSMKSETKTINIGKKKKPLILRIFRTVIVFTALTLMVFGGYYVWKTYFCEEIAAPIAGEQQPASEILEKEPVSVPTIEIIQPTPEVVIALTPEPLQSADKVFVQKEYYDVGDWIKQGDVWGRLKEYDVSQNGIIEINIEIWNKSPKQLLFSWSPSICFTLTDNTGHVYRYEGVFGESRIENEVIDSQDVKKILWKGTWTTINFSDEAVFNADVTDLYLAMQDFAVFEDVKFKIPIK